MWLCFAFAPLGKSLAPFPSHLNPQGIDPAHLHYPFIMLLYHPLCHRLPAVLGYMELPYAQDNKELVLCAEKEEKSRG